MRSVRTALAVLETVGEHQPVGLSALARHLGLPKATVQRSLNALKDAGWLVQDLLDPGRWLVSARLAVLAEATPVVQEVRAASRPHLGELRDRTGETIGLFTIDGDHMVLLEGIEGTHIVRAVERQQGMLPIHVSAAGRAMLACLPAEQRRAAVTRLASVGLHQYTPSSTTDGQELLEHLAQDAERGFAVVDGEYVEDLCGVGAAVIGPDGTPIAGLALLAPAHRMRASDLAMVGREVGTCAARISDGLRHR